MGELKGDLEKGDAELDALAAYFDCEKECVCTTRIYEFDSLVSAVVDHYGLDGKAASEAVKLIIDALNKTDMDDSEGSGYCSYCNHVLNEE